MSQSVGEAEALEPVARRSLHPGEPIGTPLPGHRLSKRRRLRREQIVYPMRSRLGGISPWEWDMDVRYKANALDCIRLARFSADASEKAVLLALAQAWV